MGRKPKKGGANISFCTRYKPSTLLDIQHYAVDKGVYKNKSEYIKNIVEKDIELLKSKKNQ